MREVPGSIPGTAHLPEGWICSDRNHARQDPGCGRDKDAFLKDVTISACYSEGPGSIPGRGVNISGCCSTSPVLREKFATRLLEASLGLLHSPEHSSVQVPQHPRGLDCNLRRLPLSHAAIPKSKNNTDEDTNAFLVCGEPVQKISKALHHFGSWLFGLVA